MKNCEKCGKELDSRTYLEDPRTHTWAVMYFKCSCEDRDIKEDAK